MKDLPSAAALWDHCEHFIVYTPTPVCQFSASALLHCILSLLLFFFNQGLHFHSLFFTLPHAHTHARIHTVTTASLGLVAVGPSWTACNRAVRPNKWQSPPLLASTSHPSSTLSDSLSHSLSFPLSLLCILNLICSHSLKLAAFKFCSCTNQALLVRQDTTLQFCCPDTQWQQWWCFTKTSLDRNCIWKRI